MKNINEYRKELISQEKSVHLLKPVGKTALSKLFLTRRKMYCGINELRGIPIALIENERVPEFTADLSMATCDDCLIQHKYENMENIHLTA